MVLYSCTAVVVFLILIMAFYPKLSWFGHERLLRMPLFKQMLLLTERHVHAAELSGQSLDRDCTHIIEVGGKVSEGHGKGKYLWHILKTLLFYKEGRVSILAGDSMQESDCFINTISVGRRFAGSFFLTPKAIANDGLLDVCMIRQTSSLWILEKSTLSRGW